MEHAPSARTRVLGRVLHAGEPQMQRVRARDALRAKSEVEEQRRRAKLKSKDSESEQRRASSDERGVCMLYCES
eukprot:3361678-Rhodomonas_salina.2